MGRRGRILAGDADDFPPHPRRFQLVRGAIRPRLRFQTLWLDELCGALRSLRFARCEGTICSPADMRNAIATYVGVEIATDDADWHASHGDLQWSNVTAPRLMVLDWECYCRAPRSYDAGRLLAFSVLDQALTRRLLARFAEDFQTSSGQVGLWSALAMVRYQIAHGQVDPSLDEPLRGLIQQLRSQFRYDENR